MIDKEKVRELAAKLFTECGLHIPKGESVITEWLEQNQPEPVVVGLSDEQITLFIETYNLHSLVGMHLREWQKTQTFMQPNEELARLNNLLHDELKGQIKSQQFQPNWDDAPDWANFIAIDDDGMQVFHELVPFFDESARGYGSHGRDKVIYNKSQRKVFERPKTHTAVELGSVWHYGAIEATVRCVNDYEVVLCNNYSGIFSVIAVTDFLAKFKRVG